VGSPAPLQDRPQDARTQPYVVQRLAGKLIGVRVGELRTVADCRDYANRVRGLAAERPGSIVICADYRRLRLMDKEVAEAALDGLRDLNPLLNRSALLPPADAPALRLQMERLLRDARNPGRRICTDAAEVRAWLSSCLDSTEQARLVEFLALSGL
jgi:hypothetical protein